MPTTDRSASAVHTPGFLSPTARRDLVFILVSAFFGALIAIAVGQYASLSIASSQLSNYTATLLKQSADVAAVSIETFSDVAASNDPICSTADLQELRYRTFQHKELYDIGRAQDGQLLCTAYFGKFPRPLPLPPPQHHEPNGDLLWRQIPHPADSRIVIDVAAHGSVVVFTSPSIFDDYQNFDPNFSSLTLTHDGRHIYRSLGKANGLLARFHNPRAAIPGAPLTATACDKTVDVCVITALSNAGLLSRSSLTSLEVALSGAGAAILFSLYTIRRRKRNSAPAEQLRRILADGRLSVVYQPLVHISDTRMVGVEALLRVTDEQGQPIPADVIVTIAEQAGLIGEITRAVVHKALAEMSSRLTSAGDFYIGINVAASDVADLAFHRYIERETERLSIPNQRVVLELTERSATNEEKLLSGVAMLRSLGFGLYIDDLGTGYSSLAYLSKLPISGVKVDKIFTQSTGKDSVTSTICEKICAIAETLGIDVVLEGIETGQQAEYFRELYPDALGQGRLWGMPAPVSMLPVPD